MRILAIDTALDQCAAALVDDGRVLAQRVEPMRRGHAEALAPMVQAVMAQAGVGFAALDRAVVTIGPGSFTGVRIGLAFARALGVARAIPVIGVTTLEALAVSAPQDGLVCAVLTAGGGWHLQLFRDGLALGAACFATDEDAEALIAAQRAPGEPLRLVGPGAPAFAERTDAAQVLDLLADPAALARLGAGRPAPDAPPAALYLRPPYPNLAPPA